FVTALYIIGEEKQAERISLIYKWSQHFIDLNKRFLEVYRSASTRDEIIEFMKSV
ncbi:MAG TPA: DUF367 domain-containing protein, partial [Thermoplasmatales archaeon]|nr:DUF367 domain-containing protein [Thermoplasmatales archaeon]